MGIVLTVLGVVFAAVCVWLVVPIVNRRERWAIGAAVLIATYAGIIGILALLARLILAPIQL
jgi:hypothetical protein